jgi:hypothetical protein
MRFRRTKTYRKKAARPPPSPNHHHQQRRTASLSCSFWVNTCKRGMNQHIENSALPNSFLQWVQMPSTTDEPQKNRSRRRSFPYLTHVVCLSPRDPWSLSVAGRCCCRRPRRPPPTTSWRPSIENRNTSNEFKDHGSKRNVDHRKATFTTSTCRPHTDHLIWNSSLRYHPL